MTDIVSLPAGTKLLCIKSFQHGPDHGEMWSNVQRLTKGKVYVKAETTSTGNIGIDACDAGYHCYWDDGSEHFIAIKDQVLLIELWDQKHDTMQFQAVCSDESAVDRWVKSHWGYPVRWPKAGDVDGYELQDKDGNYLGFDLIVTKEILH